MAEEVGVKVGITVDGAATLKSMKQELKEAQGQALALSRQFGELSPEAQAAAKRVAELKDEMSDLNERVQLMDPGSKFATFGNAVKGVAGGFTAAQGALATFGAESEDLTKTLVKLQGAMALSEGLSTIGDSWKDFQRLGSVVKTQVVNAFTTLRGAIIATGLGALAVAIGLIIANFDKIEAKIQELFPAFEGFGKLFGKVKAIAMGALNGIIESFKVVGEIIIDIFSGDFSGAIDTAKSAGNRIGKAYVDGFNEEVADQIQEAARKATEALIKRQENDLKILKAYGDKRKKEAEALELDIAKNKVRITKDGTAEEREAQAAAFTDLQALQISQSEAAKAEAKKSADEAKAARDKRFQEELTALKRQQELQRRAMEIAGKDTFNLKEQELNAQLDLYRKYGQDLKDIQNQQALEELDRRQKLNEGLQQKTTEFHKGEQAALINVGNAIKELNDKNNKAQTDGRKKVEESEKAKQQAYEQTVNYINFVSDATQQGSELEQAAALAGALAVQYSELSKQDAWQMTQSIVTQGTKILGQQTAIGKGVAIAAATIDTYKAAQSSFSALSMIPIVGPALGAVAAAAAIVAGIARVKAITAVKVPGGITGGVSPISSATSMNAPNIPQVNPAANTLIDQAIQQNSNLRQPQRVYVLETDITDTQERVAKIEANAQF